jgi:prephenate dehydrogenase
MSVRFERVAVVGVGLIGGSVAMELGALGLAGRRIGVDLDEANLAQALELGIVDEAASLASAAAGADLVVVAVPPAEIPAVVLEAAEHTSPSAVLTDVGSVKGPVAAALAVRLSRFVPGHPVAGTEKSGAAAAMRDLFRGRRCILTPGPTTDGGALAAVRDLWEALGAEVVLMDPQRHDLVCAAVSHLPHAAVYALTSAIGACSERWPELVGLGAGGFIDTTRIASSDPRMWRDVFLLNRDAVLESLAVYRDRVEEITRLIATGDGPGLERFFGEMKVLRARMLQGR